MILDNVKIWVRKNKNEEWYDLSKSIEVGSFSITETLSGNYECGKFNWIANLNDKGITEKYKVPFEPYMQLKLEIEGYTNILNIKNEDVFTPHNNKLYFTPFSGGDYQIENVYQQGYLSDYELLINEGVHKISEFIDTSNLKIKIYANEHGNTSIDDLIDVVYGDFEFNVGKTQKGFIYKNKEYVSFSIELETVGATYWLLENDRTYRKGIGAWCHEITFTEPTLLLEFKTVDSINFSKATGNEIVPRKINYNNLYDMVSRIREITPISPYIDGKRLLPYYFNITNELEIELKKHDSFDTSYSGNNLYEVIFDIFSSFNAIPRLELDSNGEFKNLTFRRRNVKKELVDLSNGECGYESHNNATNYVSSYKGNLQNAILQNNNIIDSGWVAGKPVLDDNADKLTTENYGFDLDNPVKKIIKAECKLNLEDALTIDEINAYVYHAGKTGDEQTQRGPFNIKNYFPKLWNIFDVSKFFLNINEFEMLNKDMKKTLFYYDNSRYIKSQINSKEAGNLDMKTIHYVAINSIKEIWNETIYISDGLKGNLTYGQLITDIFASGYKFDDYKNRCLSLQFKFKYITDMNINFNLHKDLYKVGNFSKEININQNNNVVDLDKFSSYAKDALISQGNEELQYLRITDKYSNCYKLGQYDKNGYVVTQVVNTQFRELWYSRMLATKNFQNANGFYKPSQSLIKYAIDKDNIFNRKCIIKDFVILDTINYSNTNSFLNDIYMSSFNFNDDNKDIYFTNSYIIVKSKNGYYGNVTYNKIEFNSPILAGKSISQDNTVKLVFYTDAYRIDGNTYTNGELIRSWFEIGKFDLSSNAIYGIKKIPQYASQKNLYPYTKLAFINALELLKDPGETLTIEYQIHHLSNNLNIIVGPAMAKYNRFVTNKSINYSFFTSNNYYNINDKYIDNIATVSKDLAKIEDNKVIINVDSGFKSWGMFNFDTNELFFVVNSNKIKEIYLNFDLNKV